MLDVGTEGHGALLLLTMLGMVTTEGDELLANGATAVGLSLAVLRMLDDALHLLARRQAAVGVATLAGVHQRLDTTLDGLLAGLLGIGLLVVRRRRAIVDIEAELLHLVRVTNLLLAHDAQIKVLWGRKRKKQLFRNI